MGSSRAWEGCGGRVDGVGVCWFAWVWLAGPDGWLRLVESPRLWRCGWSFLAGGEAGEFAHKWRGWWSVVGVS